MGFFVTESLDFPTYGVSHSNCYVTIKATYSHSKAGAASMGFVAMPMGPANGASSNYQISARMYIYAAKDANLLPLKEETVFLNLDAASATPIADIYSNIVTSKFASKTITADM